MPARTLSERQHGARIPLARMLGGAALAAGLRPAGCPYRTGVLVAAWIEAYADAMVSEGSRILADLARFPVEPSNGGLPWTDAEERLLAAAVRRRLPSRVVARVLGRSLMATRVHAWQLGLRRRPKARAA